MTEEKKSKSTKTIKEKYLVLQKKNDLPPYEEFNEYFNIENLETNNLSEKDILSVISNTIETYEKYPEEIIQPDTSIKSMNESNAFNSEEKKEIMELIRIMAKLHREVLLTQLINKNYSRIINKTFNEWKKIKEKLKMIFEKMIISWNETEPVIDNEKYFG